MNDLKSSNFSGELSIAKQYGRFRVQTATPGNMPPTLPDVMVNYTFTKAKYTIDVQDKYIDLKFSKVNEIMTEYCRECLPVYCTLTFFEMLNKQFSPIFAPIFSNGKLESAINLYKTL